MRKKVIGSTLSAMLVAFCVAAEAQQAGKVPRIGVLWPDSAPAVRIEEFRQGLRDLGYVEGQNVAIEYRYADGKRDRLPELAAELVRLKVDVIVALTTLAARPAKQATKTTPIVMISGDPIETGLITSLARPGGNVTGLTFLSPDLVGKRMELLKEVVPRLSRVAILWDSEGPAKRVEFKEAEAAAPTLGLQIQSLKIQAPSPDLDGVFGSAATGRAGALLTLGNPLTLEHRKQIAELAVKSRLPSMFDSIHFVEVGGLLSYGPNFSELYRRSAIYVDKILKGAKPADIPVEQPSKFEFFANLKTANQIGLTIPPNVLVRADKVIK
jgi:putative ABC transport system substrate-binding protein